ncbi:hypothetical protein B0H13DRAFT_1863022 [Mycena leptocephala]|nr:hypothetical protein B0H13DRAFT_1863022 [Mycena leptocephala]
MHDVHEGRDNAGQAGGMKDGSSRSVCTSGMHLAASRARLCRARFVGRSGRVDAACSEVAPGSGLWEWCLHTGTVNICACNRIRGMDIATVQQDQNKVFRSRIIATSCWGLGEGNTSWLQKEIFINIKTRFLDSGVVHVQGANDQTHFRVTCHADKCRWPSMAIVRRFRTLVDLEMVQAFR